MSLILSVPQDVVQLVHMNNIALLMRTVGRAGYILDNVGNDLVTEANVGRLEGLPILFRFGPTLYQRVVVSGYGHKTMLLQAIANGLGLTVVQLTRSRTLARELNIFSRNLELLDFGIVSDPPFTQSSHRSSPSTVDSFHVPIAQPQRGAVCTRKMPSTHIVWSHATPSPSQSHPTLIDAPCTHPARLQCMTRRLSSITLTIWTDEQFLHHFSLIPHGRWIFFWASLVDLLWTEPTPLLVLRAPDLSWRATSFYLSSGFSRFTFVFCV
ncbi:hypothetical protein K438DRAFT_2012669 [Mycena galopus ATCC 62051]|nr:hypothetical protein K438DRAFT_2012669 [Mycena galopus ATCC 62051]